MKIITKNTNKYMNNIYKKRRVDLISNKYVSLIEENKINKEWIEQNIRMKKVMSIKEVSFVCAEKRLFEKFLINKEFDKIKNIITLSKSINNTMFITIQKCVLVLTLNDITENIKIDDQEYKCNIDTLFTLLL